MKQTTICTLLFAFVGVGAAFAQTPDTTSAERYLSLEVGNVWEYESWIEECLDIEFCYTELVGYQRWTVEQDSVVEAQAYKVLAQQGFNLEGEGGLVRRILVRFDEAQARGFRLYGGVEEPWPGDIPCPLDAPTGGPPIECGEYEDLFFADAGEVGVDSLGSQVQRSAKLFTGLITWSEYAADIGLLTTGAAEFGGSWITLAYARVGDLEYGTRVPVSVEGPPAESTLTLSVYPNPSSGAATVQLSLDAPQRVRLSVYDVLGRRVFSDDLGARTAGAMQHRLDTARLPAGVYLVRLTGDAGMVATTRFVRQ